LLIVGESVALHATLAWFNDAPDAHLTQSA
jgi:hypothetical protein